MEITNIRFLPIDKKDSRLKAIAIVTFDNVFVVRDIRVIDGDNGLFIAMPSFKQASGTFRDVCHPISKEYQKVLETKIIDNYHINYPEV